MRTMLKGKIHRARVTDANVDYEGSITIDVALLEAADIIPYEKVHVLDIDNGGRVETYALPGGPGEVCVNGAAAQVIHSGDTVIVLSYQEMDEEAARRHRPRIVLVDERNIRRETEGVPPAFSR